MFTTSRAIVCFALVACAGCHGTNDSSSDAAAGADAAVATADLAVVAATSDAADGGVKPCVLAGGACVPFGGCASGNVSAAACDEISECCMAGSSALAIFNVAPDSAMVATPLTVTGVNFSVPTSLNTVTIGGVAIGSFIDDGTANTLQFAVPAIPNLAANGQLLPLVVKNQAGDTATATVLVRPFAQAASGSILSTPAQLLTAGTLASPSTLRYSLSVTALASLAASYSAILTSTNPAFAPQFLDAGGNPTGASSSFDLPANPTGDNAAATLPLTIAIDVAGPLADGATGRVSLLVVCTTSDSVLALNAVIADPLTIGAPIPDPSAAGVTVALRDATTTATGAVVVTRPQAGQTAQRGFAFEIVASTMGATTVSVAMLPSAAANATGWSPLAPTQAVPVLPGIGTASFTTTWALAPDAVDATLQVTAQHSPSGSATYYLPIIVAP